MRIGIYSFAFVLGVGLLQQQSFLPDLAWSIGLLIGVFLAYRLQRLNSEWLQYAGKCLLLGVAIGAGFFWAALWAHVRLADALPPTSEGRDITIVGVVAEMPQHNPRSVRFRFDVEQILTPDASVPVRIQLSWYWDNRQGESGFPSVAAGERWQLVVRLKRPHGNVNPHVADYEAKLFARNVRAVGYVRPAGDNLRLAEIGEHPKYFVERKRETIRAEFQRYLSDYPYVGVLVALTVGDQRAIPSAQWEIFTRTGTNHLMAISGLHITLVSGLVFMLAYWVWRRHAGLVLRLPARKFALLAGLFAAFGYALLAGFAVPARRAFLMLMIMILAFWRDRRISMASVLGWVLLVVVVLDPWAVISPGFWLSFGAVSLITYVVSGRIGRWRAVIGWVRIQWVITLGLLPLLLIIFQQVSLVSPVANALAIPVMTVVIVPLALLAVLPGLEVLLPIAHVCLQLVMTGLQWLAELPLATWQQHTPSFWALAAAMAGVVWLLLPGGPGLGVHAGFPARWLGVLAMLPLFLVSPLKPAEGELWLTVLDVGQGLAVVARTRHHVMLYDAGPRLGETDSGARVIVPYLRGEGIQALDMMMISHADSDHSGGALSVLKSLQVKTLLAAMEANHPIRQTVTDDRDCLAGNAWTWDGVRFEVLHPMQPVYLKTRNTNESSCVLKITTPHGSVLLPADIGQATEIELLQRARDKLPATVLIAPHHGSHSSSSAAFVRQVNPDHVIFSTGYRNSFGHPRKEVVDRYRLQGSRLRRNDQDGAVLLHFAQGRVEVDTWRARKRRYWHDRWADEAK